MVKRSHMKSICQDFSSVCFEIPFSHCQYHKCILVHLITFSRGYWCNAFMCHWSPLTPCKPLTYTCIHIHVLLFGMILCQPNFIYQKWLAVKLRACIFQHDMLLLVKRDCRELAVLSRWIAPLISMFDK